MGFFASKVSHEKKVKMKKSKNEKICQVVDTTFQGKVLEQAELRVINGASKSSVIFAQLI